MNFEHRPVNLDEINFDDHTFCLSYPCRAVNLRSSLDLVGIIHPPVLRERKPFQIVCGRGRLQAALDLGFQSIICKVLPSWIDDLTCLMISFEENITSRGFNVVEKALLVEKFQNYLPDEEIIRQILPRLGFGPSYKHFEFLRKISFLEEEGKELLLQGKINPKVAVKLLDFSEEDRKILLEFFKALSPTASRQRQIIEILQDLSRRDNLSLREIFEEEGVQKFLHSEKLTPRQKEEAIYRHLWGRLMPRLKALEEQFKAMSSAFAPLGTKLKHPPSFEKRGFILELEFKDLAELPQKLQALQEFLRQNSSLSPQKKA